MMTALTKSMITLACSALGVMLMLDTSMAQPVPVAPQLSPDGCRKTWPGDLNLATSPGETADFAASGANCIGGTLFIKGNPSGKFPDVFQGLVQVEGSVWIEGSWFNKLDLPRLSKIKGDLVLTGNYNLKDLSGLGALRDVGGHVYIQDHPILRTLRGLDRLVNVGGNLVVSKNQWLQDLNGLGKLNHVQEHVYIQQNTRLTDIKGLGALSVAASVYITQNPLLDEAAALSLARRHNPSSSIVCENLSGRSCQAQPGAEHASAQPTTADTTTQPSPAANARCPNGWQGNLTFADPNSPIEWYRDRAMREKDIAAFAASGCTHINGSLTVYRYPKNKLPDALRQVRSISNLLEITDNKKLDDLSAFSNLEQVGKLIITANPRLKNYHGLENLRTVTHGLEVKQNTGAADLTGLGNLESLSGPLYWDDRYWQNNFKGLGPARARYDAPAH